jgi:hypothetical protein
MWHSPETGKKKPDIWKLTVLVNEKALNEF